MSLKDVLKKVHVGLVPLSDIKHDAPVSINDPLSFVNSIEAIVHQYKYIPYKSLRFIVLDYGPSEESWRFHGKSLRYARALCRPSVLQRVNYEATMPLTSPLDGAKRMGSVGLYFVHRMSDHLFHTSQENALSFYHSGKERDMVRVYLDRCTQALSQVQNRSTIESTINRMHDNLNAYEQWSHRVKELLKRDS